MQVDNTRTLKLVIEQEYTTGTTSVSSETSRKYEPSTDTLAAISNTYELHCRRTIAIPPKERIGLTASVCGLKRQADDLFTRVSQHGSTQSQGACMPTLPPSLVHGLVESQTVLAQLETLLQNVARLPQERTSLIRADYLVVTFTEAVVLMSDLEECLKCLDAPRTGALEVDQQGSNLASLSQRLNTQCVIWRTQLDMLQWYRCTDHSLLISC